MNVLLVGDVVAQSGCDYVKKVLPALRRELSVDFTVINGENSAEPNGISPQSAAQLFAAGADVITTGNHAFRQKSAEMVFEDERILRPANFHRSAPGVGVCVVDCGRYAVAVINLIGRLYLEPHNSPFDCVDELLKTVDTPIVLVDFHAEATSEKKVMGYHLDGRVSAVIGTHTHVPTADETVLDDGTAYITDVGMVGGVYSILGADVQASSYKVKTALPCRLPAANGAIRLNAVVIDIDEKTGKARSIERVVR